MYWFSNAFAYFRLNRMSRSRNGLLEYHEDDKIKVSNGVFSHGDFSPFRAEISSFRVAGFVSLHGVVSSFRLFAWSFFSSFRLFAWRFFVFSSFSVASKRRNGAIQRP